MKMTGCEVSLQNLGGTFWQAGWVCCAENRVADECLDMLKLKLPTYLPV